MKITMYKNCIKARLLNRRIFITKKKDDQILISIKRLVEKDQLDPDPAKNIGAISEMNHKGIMHTTIALSEEAAETLMHCLSVYFNVYKNSKP